MIPALVAGAAVIGAFLTLSIYAITATRRAGVQQARADVLDEKLKSATVVNSELVNRLKDETGRADALDVLLADYAVSGPVLGSHERLLSRWRTTRAVDSRNPIAVPDAGTPIPAPRHPDDLLRPGE